MDNLKGQVRIRKKDTEAMKRLCNEVTEKVCGRERTSTSQAAQYIINAFFDMNRDVESFFEKVK